jgi:hypothetical protein
MGLLGDLLSIPLRIANAPLRAVEDLVGIGEDGEDERIISKPLDALADELEDVDE